MSKIKNTKFEELALKNYKEYLSGINLEFGSVIDNRGVKEDLIKEMIVSVVKDFNPYSIITFNSNSSCKINLFYPSLLLSKFSSSRQESIPAHYLYGLIVTIDFTYSPRGINYMTFSICKSILTQEEAYSGFIHPYVPVGSIENRKCCLGQSNINNLISSLSSSPCNTPDHLEFILLNVFYFLSNEDNSAGPYTSYTIVPKPFKSEDTFDDVNIHVIKDIVEYYPPTHINDSMLPSITSLLMPLGLDKQFIKELRILVYTGTLLKLENSKHNIDIIKKYIILILKELTVDDTYYNKVRENFILELQNVTFLVGFIDYSEEGTPFCIKLNLTKFFYTPINNAMSNIERYRNKKVHSPIVENNFLTIRILDEKDFQDLILNVKKNGISINEKISNAKKELLNIIKTIENLDINLVVSDNRQTLTSMLWCFEIDTKNKILTKNVT